jgi:hypothetical protein
MAAFRELYAVVAADQPQMRKRGKIGGAFVDYYPWVRKIQFRVTLIKFQYLNLTIPQYRQSYDAVFLHRPFRYAKQQPNLVSESEYSGI